VLTRARKAIYRMQGYCPARLGDETFRGDPYHSKFWRKATAGRWEPETLALLARHLDRNSDYLDIGAWIGPTVLYGARKARHVWAFEPDPVAFRALSWNIELNGLTNVSALPAAIWDHVGIARMAGYRGEAGDSTTSLLNATGEAGSDVLTIGWDDFVGSADLSAVSLVKIDIEGAEFDVLPRLAPWLEAHRPALLLSTHAPYLDEGTRQNRMQTLAETLAFYGGWQDTKGQAMTADDLMTDDALTRFRTVLLTG